MTKADRLAEKKRKLYIRNGKIASRIRELESIGQSRMNDIIENGNKRANAYWLRSIDPKLRKLDNEREVVEQLIIQIEEWQDRNLG